MKVWKTIIDAEDFFFILPYFSFVFFPFLSSNYNITPTFSSPTNSFSCLTTSQIITLHFWLSLWYEYDIYSYIIPGDYWVDFSAIACSSSTGAVWVDMPNGVHVQVLFRQSCCWDFKGVCASTFLEATVLQESPCFSGC